MKFRNYIFVSFLILSTISFSQPFFSNIDSLLIKNVEALNKRDSLYYASLLNHSVIFKGKTTLTKQDSLIALKPFYEAFSSVLESMKEMVLSSDFPVAYSGYECLYNKMDLSKANGKIRLKVSLILNYSFLVRMPFTLMADNGRYSIEFPMTAMFMDEKE